MPNLLHGRVGYRCFTDENGVSASSRRNLRPKPGVACTRGLWPYSISNERREHDTGTGSGRCGLLQACERGLALINGMSRSLGLDRRDCSHEEGCNVYLRSLLIERANPNLRPRGKDSSLRRSNRLQDCCAGYNCTTLTAPIRIQSFSNLRVEQARNRLDEE
jgi:hypothetical protein